MLIHKLTGDSKRLRGMRRIAVDHGLAYAPSDDVLAGARSTIRR